MEIYQSQNCEHNFEKNWRIHTDSKTQDRTVVNAAVLCRDKNRHIHEWKKRESPEIEPHEYGQLIFDKSTQVIEWGKKPFETNSGRTEHPQAKTNKQVNLSPYYAPFIKVHSKWIINLNIRGKSAKLVEGAVEANLSDIRLGKDLVR